MAAEAGLIEKATGLWGKAGLRSLERSALVEAAEQLAQALNLIATLPTTLALRREQIELQVALITPLIHTKGYAAPETKAAIEQARLLIEEANARGEPPEDPLLLFSVLYSFWLANCVAGNGDDCQQRCRDKVSARKPTNWAPFARHREISVCMGLRGGAGRTRTSNQPIITCANTNALKARPF